MARSPIEQAGAVVFRRHGHGYRVLVISSKRTARRWIFPKGHVDDGESPRETALREAEEEAGVLGRVVKPLLPPVKYRLAGAHYRVRYFLVESTGTTQSDENRTRRWLSVDRAQTTLTDDAARELLGRARGAIERAVKRRRLV